MTVVRYRGGADIREISSEVLDSFGFEDVPSLYWQKSNGFEIDVDPALAAFLLAQGSDFEPGDPNDTFASLVSSMGGRILGSVKHPFSAVINTASVTPVAFLGGGLLKSVTVGTRPITVKYGGYVYHTVINQSPKLCLYQDGVQIDFVPFESMRASALGYIEREIPLTALTAGTYTFEVRLGQVNAVAGANAIGTSVTPQTLIIREG